MGKTFKIIGLIGMIFVSSFAQKNLTDEELRRKEERRVTQSFEDLRNLEKSTTVAPSPGFYQKVFHQLPPTAERAEHSQEQSQQLRPDAEDSARFENFLKTPNTGLVKLFPDLRCESKYVVRADENCQTIIPRSSFYSFRKATYPIKSLADIRIKDNYFVSDGLRSHGILVALGDVPIETISQSSDGMKFLFDYKPAKKSDETLNKSEELITGVKDGSYIYAKYAPVIKNTTYAIRVIAYRGSLWTPLYGWFVYDILEDDKRVDIIAVFRVVKIDKDGILTLIWKELERKDSPKLKSFKLR